ncbi:hypothetical protein DID88_009378 [Monilinia fructigena]|uniref:Uncharacterized protein n=1 Tax=Monilinia fructigena TaxID=38457 RepID=A0A395ISY4_9HELO|nr:hypothetical protein DID88_009378 [Monilinia fructigena]
MSLGPFLTPRLEIIYSSTQALSIHLTKAILPQYFTFMNDVCSSEITAMIAFADLASIVDGRKKKLADAILPQNLRHALFYRIPEVAELVASGWLQFLGGDMGTHIKVLRATTDLISKAGFDVKLVGLLGGDKLTVESEPHLHPGNLGEWGPVDEFLLIINARRDRWTFLIPRMKRLREIY